MKPTEKQITLMSHALGADEFYKQKGFYRNRFCAYKGGEDHQEWVGLVDAGYAVKNERAAFLNKDCDFFHCTEKAEILIRQVLHERKIAEPKISRSRRRYQAYLSVSDTTDETYGQWLKNKYWSEYRRKLRV